MYCRSRRMTRKLAKYRILEYDFYELCYKLSIKMAEMNKEYDAETYFEEAFMAENLWLYEDMFCYKLLNFASTGTDKDFFA